MRLSRRLCACLLVSTLLIASGARATAIYNYVGLNWGEAGGGVSGDSANMPSALRAIEGQQHLTFSMILSEGLAPGSYNLANDPRLLSFSLNDGRLTVTQANARYFSMFIRLDNEARIVAWDVVAGANFDLGSLGLYALDMQVETGPSPPIGTADFSILQRCSQLSGAICSDPLATSTGQVFGPGRWTAPEPGTLALTGLALLGLAVGRRRYR